MSASNYYKETLPKMVEQYKLAVEQCLSIIGDDVDSELSDDKLHNVLKAKKMASEDVIYYAKKIDDFENEINGVVEDVEQKIDPVEAERLARAKLLKG